MKCVGGIQNFYSGYGFADFKITISCICRLDRNNQTYGGNDSCNILYVDTIINLPPTLDISVCQRLQIWWTC